MNDWPHAPVHRLSVAGAYMVTAGTYGKERLFNTNQNPMRHGLAKVANQYKWCSAKWFEQNGDRPFVKTVMNFKTDKVKVVDDF